MSTKLARIAEVSKLKKKEVFTSLAHLLDENFLTETWASMNPNGAPGIDGVTMQEYEQSLSENITSLVTRLKTDRYRASAPRRIDIPKGRNAIRPLSIPNVEDRLLQKSVARILEQIFEADFIKSSFGFRPNLGPHKALKALRNQIVLRKTMWIYEVDIKGYFNKVNHEWLMKMLKLRIADPVILRLIGKWLKVGTLQGGIANIAKEGTPQGSPVSCVLSNIYLHFVLDLWFANSVQPRLRGESALVRFVDDFVLCFQYKNDALRIHAVLKRRLAKFNLSVAEDKSSLLCFGRFSRERTSKKGHVQKYFVFLGFKHVCGVGKDGKYTLVRIPSTKSCSKFLKKTKDWLWRHMHWSVKLQQKYIIQMLQGFYCYFGLAHCSHKLNLVRNYVRRQWRRVLRRRSQKGPYKYWSFLTKQEWFKLPNPRLVHSNV